MIRMSIPILFLVLIAISAEGKVKTDVNRPQIDLIFSLLLILTNAVNDYSSIESRKWETHFKVEN